MSIRLKTLSKAARTSNSYREMALKLNRPLKEIVDACNKHRIKPKHIILTHREYCHLKYTLKMSKKDIAERCGVSTRDLEKWTAKNKYNTPFYLRGEELMHAVIENGYSYQKLAEVFSVSYNRLREFLTKENIKLPKQGKQFISLKEIKQLKKKKMSNAEIAQNLQCTPQNVWFRINRGVQE